MADKSKVRGAKQKKKVTSKASASVKGGGAGPIVCGYRSDLGVILGDVPAKPQKPWGRVVVCSANMPPDKVVGHLLEGAPEWVVRGALGRGEEIIFCPTVSGPFWIVKARGLVPAASNKAEGKGDGKTGRVAAQSHAAAAQQRPGLVSHGGLVAVSSYAKAREMAGRWLADPVASGLEGVSIDFSHVSREEVLGFGVGLEMGLYRYQKARAGNGSLNVHLADAHTETFKQAKSIGLSVNTSRHLVNMPPGQLTPSVMVEAASSLFGDHASAVTCEVWDNKRLLSEGMGLLSGVGQGAEDQPCLLVMKYRPGKSKNPKRVAIVGKGVTFDTGGLDLKGADNMRLMKKDMGGAASVLGFARWLDLNRPDFPCDLYLALAENAIGPKAIRPGDVLKARNGATVEIHNTDAEGRLVMADAMDVALTPEDPDNIVALIDVATLTGAIKVALGTRFAGLFSNYDPLAELCLSAGQTWGDPCWRMPVVDEYGDQLRSSVADFMNCSSSRFGGAITAAVFLQRFVRGKPWAHLDIYGWTDRADGPCREEGGSGQGVQCLIGLVERWSRHMSKL